MGVMKMNYTKILKNIKERNFKLKEKLGDKVK